MPPCSCNSLLLACLICVASGCALNRPAVLTSTVGPPPSRSPKGALAVYSAFDYGTPTDADYRTSTSSEDPERVPLSPGLYKITARASAFGKVTLPVLIESGKTTSIHLDGSELSDWSR